VNTPAYDKDVTALLVVDPYNDFISDGGKIWARIKAVAEANNSVGHMLEVLDASLQAKLHVFYAMHHRYRPGDYETCRYIAPIQKGAWQHRTFEFGTWGASSVPNSCRHRAKSSHRSIGVLAVSPTQTWICSSRSTRLIVIGLIAHTCVEATVRYAAELGYESPWSGTRRRITRTR
jgi:nicotinamidase-related amidase